MLYRSATLIALSGLTVLASPLQRRQETTAAAPTSASTSVAATGGGSAASTSTAVSTVSSGTAAASSAASSGSSALSSVLSSAAAETGGSTAPLPTSTTQANATDAASFVFGCPDGYSITYALGLAPYADVPIEQAYSALEDWGMAIPPPIESVSSEGMGEGAMRSWSLSAAGTNLSVSEVLTRVNETPSTFLEQEWNLTSPITISPSLIISNYTNVLTLYSNSTDNVTTVQLFSNFCTSNQTAGLTALSQLVTVYLTGLSSLFANASSSSNSTMANMTSSMMPTSTMMSGTSGVAASASSAAGSLSSAAQSATGGILSSITGAPSSIAGGALSSVTGVPASLGSSILGGVTSLF